MAVVKYCPEHENSDSAGNDIKNGSIHTLSMLHDINKDKGAYQTSYYICD